MPNSRRTVRSVPVAAGWGCLLAAVVASAGCGGQELPSVVLISMDTLRADHLGCYGYFRQTSPVMDALAREGVLFENAVTPMATTLPAHVSLMTGASPRHHGILGNFHAFETPLEAREGMRTAAQMFKEMGYTTAAFVSAIVVGSETGLASGFDVFDEPEAGERRGEITTRKVMDWLDSGPDGPLFLWVHYFDPHWPYDPPRRFAARFRQEEGLSEFLKRLHVPRARSPQVVEWNNTYDGEVAYVDEQLGRVLQKLKEFDRFDSSAIVLTSDHGEGLGQHNWPEHGQIWNEQLFVPLIIKLPRGMGRAGERRPDLVWLTDILPTLGATLDLPFPEGAAGQFEGLDALAGTAGRDAVFCERTPLERGWGPGEKYALTGLEWKYFHHTGGEDELFDMQRDRTETANVIADFPEVASEMRARIESILEESRSRGIGLSRKTEISAEREEQLRALGYAR